MASFEEIWLVLVQAAKTIEYVETFSHKSENEVAYNAEKDSIRFFSRSTDKDHWRDIQREYWEMAWAELESTGELTPNQFLDVTNVWRSAAAVPFLRRALDLPLDSDGETVLLPDDFAIDDSVTEAGIGADIIPDPDEQSADLAPPKQVETTTSRIVRNTTIGRELKQLYDYTCQVCGNQRQQGPEQAYAEAHHIHPLGATPPGPDDQSNLLVLCPNHHADFDYGVIEVDPESYRIRHGYDSEVDRSELEVDPEHPLSEAYLQYHNTEISKL